MRQGETDCCETEGPGSKSQAGSLMAVETD